METLAVGDVVLVPFPYADFSRFKKRPALVVGLTEFDNLILCQITSKSRSSKRALALKDDDFSKGGLQIDSYIRPDKLFTVEQSIVQSKVGMLKVAVLADVRLQVRRLFG